MLESWDPGKLKSRELWLQSRESWFQILNTELFSILHGQKGLDINIHKHFITRYLQKRAFHF